MAVRIKSITFDCTDPYRLAQFWSQLTGFEQDPDNAPTRPMTRRRCCCRRMASLALLFIAVPEQKKVKNRCTLIWCRPTARGMGRSIDCSASAADWSTTSADRTAPGGW